MAFATLRLFPPPLSTSFSPSRLLLSGARAMPARRRRVRAAAVSEDGAAVVWFKHDLRADDHPGLVAAAAQHRIVLPLYVFDPRILSRFSDEMLELLLIALGDLKSLLKDQGSDLLIGFGSAEDVIVKYANEVKTTHIFAEEEVEYNLRRVVCIVSTSLSVISFSWGTPKFVLWDAPLYDIKDWKGLPTSYPDFQKLQLSQKMPFVTPSLPALNMGLGRGELPTFHDLKKFLNGNPSELDQNWISLKKISAKTLLREKQMSQIKMGSNFVKGLETHKENNNENSLLSNNVQRAKKVKSFFAPKGGFQVAGGTDIVLNALSAYLRYLEGTSRGDWQELHEKVREAKSREGASFGALFGSSFYLGTISRRRVYYEAIKYEKERNAGFVSPFGYSASTVAAAVDAIYSMEWYWILALKSQLCNEGMYPIRIWRWKGYLIQYAVLGDKGPGVLLVHGFGAFLEHFRGNISSIADIGHRVWAVTLLGFGKSEKPNVVYSEHLWAELLRDFVIDVVGEPVHLVGNSIGGYFVASLAGLWPALAKSLVLINTAGSVIPGSSAVVFSEATQTSGFAWLGSRLLLLYLRLSAGSILKNCYPNNTERVDCWLISEIIRAVMNSSPVLDSRLLALKSSLQAVGASAILIQAKELEKLSLYFSFFKAQNITNGTALVNPFDSYDPGVLVVLESVFNFSLAIPINYLIDSFGGKVLIIQGMRDPLSKSKFRLSMLREHCGGVTIKEMDAGHCPHDEMPDEVNSILDDWVQKAESFHPVERT